MFDEMLILRFFIVLLPSEYVKRGERKKKMMMVNNTDNYVDNGNRDGMYKIVKSACG